MHSPFPNTLQFYLNILPSWGWYFLHLTITNIGLWILHWISPEHIFFTTSHLADLPCQEQCTPWGLLHQIGAKLLTLALLEGKGEEERKKEKTRRRKVRERRRSKGGWTSAAWSPVPSPNPPFVQSASGYHSPSQYISSDAPVDLCNLQLNY